jgi:hypothetical protein
MTKSVATRGLRFVPISVSHSDCQERHCSIHLEMVGGVTR